uniref:LSM7 homolog, U6 small nuclear RNA and mRNA degradation associated n=1 Tax=Rattus norvegicus TaxID=10116 RepID=A0ABK0M2S4_RAT
MADKEKKKKESILDLSKYIDKTIRVKFQGGREASGILKGFDPLLNLVLDGTIEYMRGTSQTGKGSPGAAPEGPRWLFIEQGLLPPTL